MTSINTEANADNGYICPYIILYELVPQVPQLPHARAGLRPIYSTGASMDTENLCHGDVDLSVNDDYMYIPGGVIVDACTTINSIKSQGSAVNTNIPVINIDVDDHNYGSNIKASLKTQNTILTTRNHSMYPERLRRNRSQLSSVTRYAHDELLKSRLRPRTNSESTQANEIMAEAMKWYQFNNYMNILIRQCNDALNYTLNCRS